jgi:hypothetical protein
MTSLQAALLSNLPSLVHLVKGAFWWNAGIP